MLPVLGGLFIVVFTASVISVQIADRRSFASSELREDVMERWGAPISQAAPSVKVVQSGSVFKGLESLPLASQEISVSASMSYRKRGLVYFSGFDMDFVGDYAVVNRHPYEIDVAFVFPISMQRNKVLLSDLRFEVDGEQTEIHLGGDDRYLLWTGRLASGQEVHFQIGFRGRGLDSFVYVPDPELPVRAFSCDLSISGGKGYDYASGVAPATTVEQGDDGHRLRWELPSLESGVPVGVILPSERSFDALIATMARRSWAGFLLLIACCTGLAAHLGRSIHTVEVWLVAAAYAFFFVLLPYLAAFMSFYLAYLISIGVIGLLLFRFLCRVTGPVEPPGHALRTVTLLGALAASLLVPTLAVILEGYTGLIYSLEILVLLAIVMHLASRPALHILLASLRAEAQDPEVDHASP
jgi:hypothetical protein